MLDLFLIISMFVLLDPFASFPFLINAKKKRMNVTLVALKAVLAAFVIAIAIALVGPSLFGVFGISLDSFRIAGGLILLLLSISMVKPPEDDESVTSTGIITIIATPMLTGPAMISFVTLHTFDLGLVPVLLNLSVAFLAVGAVFILFSRFLGKINPSVVDMVSRVSGLFLCAVSIEMISMGMHDMIISMVQKG
ncbi:MAG: MarC family protein [Candidatus Aenigmatarchaeota archaeon]